MKLLLAIAISLFCADAQAAGLPWSSLGTEENYRLVQEVELAPGMILAPGETLLLDESGPLPGLNVSYFHFTWAACLWPETKTEMVMVVPTSAPSSADVGVLLENCGIEVYVSNVDLEMPSLLQ